jgi:hypothetical protein
MWARVELRRPSNRELGPVRNVAIRAAWSRVDLPRRMGTTTSAQLLSSAPAASAYLQTAGRVAIRKCTRRSPPPVTSPPSAYENTSGFPSTAAGSIHLWGRHFEVTSIPVSARIFNLNGMKLI